MLTWLKILAESQQDVQGTLSKNLPNTSSVPDGAFISNILNWCYAGAGIVAVGFIVYGAWKYMSANGEPERIKSASLIVLYAVIGLVVVLLAAAITNFALFNVGSHV